MLVGVFLPFSASFPLQFDTYTSPPPAFLFLHFDYSTK
jgi:hypothetical protein